MEKIKKKSKLNYFNRLIGGRLFEVLERISVKVGFIQIQSGIDLDRCFRDGDIAQGAIDRYIKENCDNPNTLCKHKKKGDIHDCKEFQKKAKKTLSNKFNKKGI